MILLDLMILLMWSETSYHRKIPCCRYKIYLNIFVYISPYSPYQLFLSICFLHPTCYQLDMPSTTTYSSSYISSSSQDMVDNLLARRTETARDILLDMIRDVQDKIKILMFRNIENGVGEIGVSLTATKSIINSVKVNQSYALNAVYLDIFSPSGSL